MLGQRALTLLLVVQAIDILLHAVTDQLEPLRLTSNAIICVAGILATRSRNWVAPVLLVGSGAYLALNVLFVIQYGMVNPTSGGLRLPLLGFVVATLAIAAWQWRSTGPSRDGHG